MTVKEKLELFWKENELGKNGNTGENWNLFKIGVLTFRLPNLNKKGYLLHDINHLLSGYGIDWLSEFEIAAWEIGSGGRKGFFLSWFYPVIGSFLGLIIIPRRTYIAYKKGTERINAHILSHKENILEMKFVHLQHLSKRH